MYSSCSSSSSYQWSKILNCKAPLPLNRHHTRHRDDAPATYFDTLQVVGSDFDSIFLLPDITVVVDQEPCDIHIKRVAVPRAAECAGSIDPVDPDLKTGI